MSIFYQFFIIVHVYIKQPLIPFKRLIEVQFEINFYMNFSLSLFLFFIIDKRQEYFIRSEILIPLRKFSQFIV